MGVRREAARESHPGALRGRARAEPARAEPARAEPARAEPAQAEPVRAGRAQAEPVRAGRAQAEPAPGAQGATRAFAPRLVRRSAPYSVPRTRHTPRASRGVRLISRAIRGRARVKSQVGSIASRARAKWSATSTERQSFPLAPNSSSPSWTAGDVSRAPATTRVTLAARALVAPSCPPSTSTRHSSLISLACTLARPKLARMAAIPSTLGSSPPSPRSSNVRERAAPRVDALNTGLGIQARAALSTALVWQK